MRDAPLHNGDGLNWGMDNNFGNRGLETKSTQFENPWAIEN